MSRHGFRFVHANCLCLDEHLVGTGVLCAEDRELAEDATFRAWDGIVNTCIAAQTEFLLLTGNSFNARTNSLRARIALEKGFEQLAAHEISVFVVPGNLDPASAWKRTVSLPPNVTLLTDEDQEPVAVVRDQKVLASLSVIATAASDESNWSGAGPAVLSSRHPAPFQIGVVGSGSPLRWEHGQPVPLDLPGVTATAASLVKAAMAQRIDYIALGEGHPFTEHFAAGVVHDPGCAQSLSRQVTGSRGCSVVNVSPGGDVTIDAVAVAPIRWEEVALHVPANTNQNELAERMALAVMEREPDNDERLWIITWRLSGEGQIFNALTEPSAQRELADRVERELTGEGSIRRIHRFDRAVAAQPELLASAEEVQGLLHDFRTILAETSDAVFEQVRRELLELDWMKHNDARFLRETVQQVARQHVARRAQALAARWLE